MSARILSTIILWTLVFLCMRFLGTTGAVLLATLIAVLTQREFYGMVRRMGMEPFDRLGMTVGALIMLAPSYLEKMAPLRAEFLIAVAVVAFSLRILRERDPQNRVETLGWTLVGVIYVPFMLHYLVRVLMISSPHPLTGLWLAVWIVAVSKFCDTGALLTGLAIGRHKMSPNISPKKTWEGAVGGVVISAGTGAFIAWACDPFMPDRFTPLFAAIAAVPIAILAIVADLIESVIKRRADIKDSGQTIPGIGGIFDLSDSLILTAPMGYAIFLFL